MSADRHAGRGHVECPVCQSTHEYEAGRDNPFRDVERDTDFRPLHMPPCGNGNGSAHPLAFGIVTCPSCFYTRELDDRHRNGWRDAECTQHRRALLRCSHLNALEKSDGLVKPLGEHLDAHRYPAATAINQLLLAIVDEEMLRPSAHLNRARYYLRIGWLWRELHATATTDLDQMRPPEKILGQVRWQAAEWRRWVENSRNLASGLSLDHGHRRSAQEHLDAIDSEIRALLNRCHDAAASRGPSLPNGEGAAAYFAWTDYPAFLSSLRGDWPDLPLSEGEAMREALRHYVHFFENERRFTSPEQEVQTAYLIGELARRTWQDDLALRYFDRAVRLVRHITHASQADPQRTRYLQKLVEMSIEQSQKVERAEGIIP